MIRSVVRFEKYVKSRPRRPKSSLSNPNSVSVPRSGLRSALPLEFGVTALVPPGPCVGLNVRSAETQRRQPTVRAPEWLLAHHPREAQLRVCHPLQLVAERGVVVDAKRTRHEDAITPAKLLLTVRPNRRVQR